MIHIALPIGFELDLGGFGDLIFSLLGAALQVDLGAFIGANLDLNLSPIFDATADLSWLFDAWNQLVLLYAQSF